MSRKTPGLKVLHTSDWHIGHTLGGKRRYEEHGAFLRWLAETIRKKDVHVLLVAGDVFDSSVPSNRAQELYYGFLCDVARSTCRHVVVVAGNHDSPSFLNAPKELLRALNIHVIGSAPAKPDDEVLVLSDPKGVPEAIVCAVPYLRDGDVRTAQAGESVDDKDRKLKEGIRAHYAAVVALAEQKRNDIGADIPIMALGHLFAAGGQTIDGDGVRQLYIGSLAQVSADVFPPSVDYVALGHLHSPQMVERSETRRYSGSPLPLGFAESAQKKGVCLVAFQGSTPSVQVLEVPAFQRIERIRGDLGVILGRIGELSKTGAAAWLEVIYDGDKVVGDLRERLEGAVAGSAVEILRVQNARVIASALGRASEEETLADLNPQVVFEQCLNANHVPDEQRPGLLRTYQEALTSCLEADKKAE